MTLMERLKVRLFSLPYIKLFKEVFEIRALGNIRFYFLPA